MLNKANSTIYIYCPANFATGGPEALHQIGQRLISLGFKVYMYYFFRKENNPVHESYLQYNVPFTDKIINSANNLIIMPETYLSPVFNPDYSKTQKLVWWLSVTNYAVSLQNCINEVKHKKFYNLKSLINPRKYRPIPTIKALKSKNVINLAHSHFSVDFLKMNGLPIIGKISDYMSDSFYQRVKINTIKEDIILYNPKKNGQYLESVKELSPDLNWKPLIGMTPDEVATWMNKSKLYIDFGYHPGQERMPREAILMGCCVITGSQGSAAYFDDVPLPDGFKFDENKDLPDSVIKQIHLTLNNFEKKNKLFENYRETIIKEKENFDLDVKNVFNKFLKN